MFQKYRKNTFGELRAYVPGEDLSGVSISEADTNDGCPKEGDMIARNPKKPEDQWLVSQKYFEENFSPIPERE